MSYKIWIGKRESDILTYEFFDYSITFYGSNKKRNVAFSNEYRQKASYSDDFTTFAINNLNTIYKRHKDIEIHFYSGVFAHKIIAKCPSYKDYVVNTNSIFILNNLRHKTLSRLWLNNSVPVPSFTLLSKDECNVDYLKRKFDGFSSFVIQKNYSGGGAGTYLINNLNESNVISRLLDHELYLVSPFYSPSQSLSCHILIDASDCVVLPVSEQVIYSKKNSLEYIGNRFLSNESPISQLIKEKAFLIGNKLKHVGYRGICGFDFICYNSEIFLVEINPRYQGSSYILNFALKKHQLPSLFELNTMCFKGEMPNHIISAINSLKVNCINNYIIYHDYNDLIKAKEIISNDNNVVFGDGYENALRFEKGCYLLRYILSCDES